MRPFGRYRDLSTFTIKLALDRRTVRAHDRRAPMSIPTDAAVVWGRSRQKKLLRWCGSKSSATSYGYACDVLDLTRGPIWCQPRRIRIR